MFQNLIRSLDPKFWPHLNNIPQSVEQKRHSDTWSSSLDWLVVSKGGGGPGRVDAGEKQVLKKGKLTSRSIWLIIILLDKFLAISTYLFVFKFGKRF